MGRAGDLGDAAEPDHPGGGANGLALRRRLFRARLALLLVTAATRCDWPPPVDKITLRQVREFAGRWAIALETELVKDDDTDPAVNETAKAAG